MAFAAAEILVGILAAAGFIFIARKRGVRGEIRLYAAGLIIAALIYVGFSVFSPTVSWKLFEMLGIFIYLPFAYLGVKRSVAWLGAGWVLHGVWDAGFHLSETAVFVPGWYPLACLGFDLFLGGYLLFWRGVRADG